MYPVYLDNSYQLLSDTEKKQYSDICNDFQDIEIDLFHAEYQNLFNSISIDSNNIGKNLAVLIWDFLFKKYYPHLRSTIEDFNTYVDKCSKYLYVSIEEWNDVFVYFENNCTTPHLQSSDSFLCSFLDRRHRTPSPIISTPPYAAPYESLADTPNYEDLGYKPDSYSLNTDRTYATTGSGNYGIYSSSNYGNYSSSNYGIYSSSNYGNYSSGGYLSYGNHNSKSSTGYVGLSNQGATCYMNSLLQSLFMTPEFRNSLFRWKYVPGRDDVEESCIPLQLQRLFARLQLSSQRSIETTALTKSFGWDSGDAFTQHDVQELCRILFDALEKTFSVAEDDAVNIINDLYQGSFSDFVHCQGCDYKSQRSDNFLDLSLYIKGLSSLEEAIEQFFTPDILEGDNAYKCSNCKQKCTAKKGFRITALPYLLTISLKRFDFDYSTMNRVKLHDRIVFPKYLDMNRFVIGDGAMDILVEDDHSDFQPDFEAAFSQETDDKKASPLTEDPHIKPTPSRPYVYELFSVMVHSGGPMGGHYYAYIKSLRSKRWFKFNDSSVSQVEYSEVESAFGGRSSHYSYDSDSAYLLFYRLVSEERNENTIDDEKIDSVILDAVEEEEEREKHKYDHNWLDIEIKYQDISHSFCISKFSTLKDLKLKAIRYFGIENPALTRLRGFDKAKNVATEPFDTREQDFLHSFTFYSSSILYLETKEKDAEWPFFNPYAINLSISLFDSSTLEYLPPISVEVDKRMQLSEFRGFCAEKTGIPLKFCHAFHVSDNLYMKRMKELPFDDFAEDTLESKNISNDDDICIENTESTKDFLVLEKFKQELDLITINYHRPDSEVTSLRIDKNSKVGFLKDKIAEKIGIHIDKFRMCDKSYWGDPTEYTHPDHFLNEANIRDKTTVEILYGAPLKPGEILLEIYQFDLLKPDLNKLFDCGVSPSEKLSQLRDRLIPLLAECKIDAPAELLRLREIKSLSVGTIVDLDSSFYDYFRSMYSGRKLAVQIIEEGSPSPEVGDYHLFFIQIDSNGEKLPKREFFISKLSTISEFGLKLQELTGIPQESISLGIGSYYIHWREIEPFDRDALVQTSLWVNDGSCFFVKDKNVVMKEVVSDDDLCISTNNNTKYKRYQPKEESLKIRTKFDKPKTKNDSK